MTTEQRKELQRLLKMLERASRSADGISVRSYGYEAEKDLVGPPTPVPPEYAIGYVKSAIERLVSR